MAKNSKNIFLFFSRPSTSFSYIITIYIGQISKSRFLGQKTGFLPKIRILEVFGKNPAVSVISNYPCRVACRVSERSLEPFSRTLKFPNQLTGSATPVHPICLALPTVTCLEALGSTVVFDYLLLLIIHFFTSSFLSFYIQ